MWREIALIRSLRLTTMILLHLFRVAISLGGLLVDRSRLFWLRSWFR